MKVKALIFFCFTALISLFGPKVSAQVVDSSRYQKSVDKPMEIVVAEKKNVFVEHDLRIGIDMHNYILGIMTPYRTGIDLNLEYNLTHDLSVLVEGGYNYFERENVRVSYISKGSYIRAGVDYNLREDMGANDRDFYYIGARYGFSLFEQEVPEYVLVNGFWGHSIGHMSNEEAYAHWFEMVSGFKVEIIKNWYLGMNLRLKFFIHRSKGGIEPVQYVPGYSQNYNSAVLDFNYTISYNIPLNYKKKKIAVYDDKK